MGQDYIKRSLEPVFKKVATEFPAVVLTGPYFSSKTPHEQDHRNRRFRSGRLRHDLSRAGSPENRPGKAMGDALEVITKHPLFY